MLGRQCGLAKGGVHHILVPSPSWMTSTLSPILSESSCGASVAKSKSATITGGPAVRSQTQQHMHTAACHMHMQQHVHTHVHAETMHACQQQAVLGAVLPAKSHQRRGI